MIIGITGNSGSGKTSICKTLEKKYDALIIDADEIVKELSKPKEKYFEEIINVFGNEILKENGELNKIKLADIIFSDSERRETLNFITYKYVGEEIEKRAKASSKKIKIIDAPLLIEGGINAICDTVISVIADEELKIKRICKRDNIDIEVAKKRLNAQEKNDFYIKNSNYVIINNNIDLEKQADDIMELIKSDILYNPKTVIIQDKDLKILQFKKLLEYKEVLTHAFTLKPFNFGSNDTYEKIKNEADNNYKMVCDLLKLDYKQIIRPYQTHTNNIKEVVCEERNF